MKNQFTYYNKTMAPLQRKNTNTENVIYDDSPLSVLRKTCPNLNKSNAASSSTVTSQQHQ
jgi:hypothetical protein